MSNLSGVNSKLRTREDNRNSKCDHPKKMQGTGVTEKDSIIPSYNHFLTDEHDMQTFPHFNAFICIYKFKNLKICHARLYFATVVNYETRQ